MTDDCCSEFAALTRRSLFAGAALAGATTMIGSAVVRASASSAGSADAVMVVLSLRGAADGLSLVVPHGDPVYYAARPDIAIPAEQLLARDDFFGLHPQLAPLVPMWTAGKLAAVHATGLPAPNRSHFAAMEEVEDADPGSAVREGWLNRLVGLAPGDSPLQAFNVGDGVPPASLYGPEAYISAGDVASMQIPGNDEWDPEDHRLHSLHRMWDPETSTLGRAMRATFRAVDEFGPVQETSDQPANGAVYPDHDLAGALAETARIIRGDVGVQVVTVDHGTWDHHVGLGTPESGRLRRLTGELAGAVAAFFRDLGPLGDKVTLVVLSEFGRRVKQNANYGLDHGYGNVMLVAGAGVNGGQYYAKWPGLAGEEDSDLLVTTDYRSVLAEVVSARFGASTSTVFPGFVRESVGVMAGA